MSNSTDKKMWHIWDGRKNKSRHTEKNTFCDVKEKVRSVKKSNWKCHENMSGTKCHEMLNCWKEMSRFEPPN